MTIRGRLFAVLVLVGAVVATLSMISILGAVETERLATEPQHHLLAGQRMHRFASTTGQVVKDVLDVIDGEDDLDELQIELARAHAGLDDVLQGNPHDPTTLSLAAVFRQLDRGITQVLGIAKHDRKDAREMAQSLGEDLYEGPFRMQLAALERQQEAITSELADQTSSRTHLRIVVTAILVVIAALVMTIALGYVVSLRRRLSTLATTVRSLGDDRSVRSRDSSTDELGQLATTFDRMADDLDHLIETRLQKEALAQELALAAHLQKSLVPERPSVPGLEIVGSMTTATEVGGDYYDVIPAKDGAWIGIGDVSGHGFNSGVVMLMAQAAIAGAIRTRPDAHPSEILRIVNDVLHENVHDRMQRHEHMTLTLLRYRDDGSVEYAGAHQEMIVRDAEGKARAVETPGPWLAMTRDLDDIADNKLELAPGDTLVLFTDGIVEAVTREEKMFGFETLFESVATTSGSAERVHDAVLSRWAASTGPLDDDATVLVVRRQEAA